METSGTTSSAGIDPAFQEEILARFCGESSNTLKNRALPCSVQIPVPISSAAVHCSLDLKQSSRWIPQFLAGSVVMFIALSLAGQFAKHVWGHGNLKGLVPLFYVDLEPSVPTWYSSFALLLAAVLLAFTAYAKWVAREKCVASWTLLAVVFALLSVDEIAGIHELPIDWMRQHFHTRGLLYYGWVIPGALFVAACGAAFLKLLFHLPARTRNQFLLAGAVFVGGAIGMEMLSGYQADLHGEGNFNYALIVTAEEALEMCGVVLFIRALLEYLRSTVAKVTLVIG